MDCEARGVTKSQTRLSNFHFAPSLPMDLPRWLGAWVITADGVMQMLSVFFPTYLSPYLTISGTKMKSHSLFRFPT